jgi:hypothetical protein
MRNEDYEPLEQNTSGWVVVAQPHRRSKNSFIVGSTFSRTKSRAINSFIEGTSKPWNYWKKEYNYKCVKATSKITT